MGVVQADIYAPEVEDTVPEPVQLRSSFSHGDQNKPIKAGDRNHSFSSLLHAVHIVPPGERRRAESEVSSGSASIQEGKRIIIFWQVSWSARSSFLSDITHPGARSYWWCVV